MHCYLLLLRRALRACALVLTNLLVLRSSARRACVFAAPGLARNGIHLGRPPLQRSSGLVVLELLPMDPQLSKMLIVSASYGVSTEILSICAMLQIGASVFYRPKERAVHADNARINRLVAEFNVEPPQI